MEGEHAGIWSILPPLVAIVLSLITKEVFFSLLIGIMSGTMIYSFLTGLGIVGIFTVTIDTLNASLTESSNAAILIFLIFLGAIVALVTRAGGSNAYGIWAAGKIKSRRGAGLLTALLSMMMFVDDYFNCLTVGTVMRPVTDRYRISREKLAYSIDAMAAPICIIAPISSWAAAVISYYPKTGVSGMQAFISAIPMNLYAMLTIFMVFYLAVRKSADYGPMAVAQRRAEEHGVTEGETFVAAGTQDMSSRGRVFDLIVPLVSMVVFTLLAMPWYGGYWDGSGKTLFNALGDTSAAYALALGGLGAVIVTFILFVPRRIMSFSDFFVSVSTGAKSMVPAMIILTLAWSISGICRDYLFTGQYVADIVQASSMPVMLIPAIMFVIAAILSFSTGTSWGTFGILIPIAISICEIVAPHLSVISLSAVLAGSVFGDHCSPISDTTILSSTGAGCNHIDHVATQLPYALTVASVCFAGYIVAGALAPLGFALTTAVTLPLSIVLLVVVLAVLPKVWKS